MATAGITASVLHGIRDLREETRELPPPAADEVQVAVKATGLCGSDLHYFTHGGIGDIHMREPMSLGHESAGVVTAVGSGVTTLKPGDRVALEVGRPCGDCAFCREGRYNICKGMKFRASARALPHIQGTLQQRINHPAKWAFKIPDSMPLEFGALAEPLSVAMHARDRGNLPAGAKVLILGAGAVGLLCAAVSRVTEAGGIVIADINADRVKFAVDNGFADAGVVFPARRPQTVEDKLALAREMAGLAAAAVVKGEPFGEASGTYECTGVEVCMQAAIYATNSGGKVMIVGLGTPVQSLPVSAASMREVDLIGVFRYANTYRRVVDLLAGSNPLLPPVGRLITHRFEGLDKVPQAFDMASKVKDEAGDLVLKVMVMM